MAKGPFIATIEQQAQAAIADFGGIRPAARALDIDHAYLSRLASGEKTNPSANTLVKLNLSGPMYYTQSAVFTACHRCDAHLLESCICSTDARQQTTTD